MATLEPAYVAARPRPEVALLVGIAVHTHCIDNNRKTTMPTSNSSKIAGIIVGGIVLMAAIGSCMGDSSTSSTPPTTTYVPSTEGASPSSSSNDFLSLVESEDSTISNAAGGDADLLLLAGGVCSDWTQGDDAAGVVNDAIQGIGEQTTTSVSAHQIGLIIGAATTTMCPAYSSQLQAWDAANA